MRKHETVKDYRTLTDKTVNWEMCTNMKTLVDFLKTKEEKLSRSEAVKISVSLNNLLKDLGL